MWAWMSFVVVPGAADNAVSQLKYEIEAEKIERGNFIVGTIVSKEASKIVLNVVSGQDMAESVIINLNANTKFYRLLNDDDSTKQAVSLSSFADGVFVTVVSVDPIGDKSNIYAAEVIEI